MTTGRQLRAARALLDLDRDKLAELSGLSFPTIQHMGQSEGVVHGRVESPIKVLEALDKAGIELISDHATSSAGDAVCGLRKYATRLGCWHNPQVV